MYEQTIIVGHCGRDPELRYTPDGTAVCDFSVAVNKVWTDSEGQKQERTKWYRVNCWRALAETVAEYVKKGRQVMVIGDASASAWIDEEGEAREQRHDTADPIEHGVCRVEFLIHEFALQGQVRRQLSPDVVDVS